jgi:DMSO/TMAO reductase YedYZ molybdopterin-dependent catalytic subunit
MSRDIHLEKESFTFPEISGTDGWKGLPLRNIITPGGCTDEKKNVAYHFCYFRFIVSRSRALCF